MLLLHCIVDFRGYKWDAPLLQAIFQDRAFWGPIAALTGFSIILARRGLPRRITHVAAFAALILLLVAVNWLTVQMELQRTCWLVLDLVLRLAVAACWVIACGGLIAFAVWLRRRNRSRPAPAWLRWWFATTLFITLAEAGTRIIERPPPAPVVTLPEHWSSAPRSGDEFRIVAIGGSTMLGFPYHPKVDIPTICRAHLAAQYPDRTFTVQNVAQNGISFQTAVEHLKDVPTRPDLILLYTGHNEVFFDVEQDAVRPESPVPLVDLCFHWSAAYRVFSQVARQHYIARREQAGDGRQLFDTPQFSERVAEERRQRFRHTLIQFARALREHEIHTVWFVPASGEGTFEPNRSTSSLPLTDEYRQAVDRQLAKARTLEQTGRWDDAEQVYRSLLERDPDVAEFHYRLAEALVQQNRIPEAKQSFRAAIDCDVYACQASSGYQQCIIDVAAQEQIPLIDAAAVLSPLTPRGLLDRTVIHDNVHPTLCGFLTLGRAAAQQVIEASFVAESPSPDTPSSVDDAASSLDDAQILAQTGIDSHDLATAYDRVAFALNHLAKQRYDPSRRHAEAEQYRRWAAALRTGEIKPGEQGTESLTTLTPGGVQLPALPSR